ncbi:Crp/Fnr family transcriptional regulator [Xylanivirga thermophila]|jgi:CRP-like cAMP-binding protein|uniref:Crp/Fnr family transcriptional regulator n=1 Tax=Xylanivirga thermophila TaxID=2496273 RepID=UPI00101B8D5F|nr:Crp/Fnr family transcriptional regulator [Xylanivirga thermophila]
MIAELRKSPLFNHMTDEDIRNCLKCSHSKVISYEKDEVIFLQQDKPKKLFILIEGSVVVCSDSISGKRNIITTISKTGEVFGEVFLFLDERGYENYAIAADRAEVLEMPKEFLYHNCGNNCGYHTLLISNMLSILAQKAYHLNQKLQIMSSSTLRQKISKLLLQNVDKGGNVILKMKREELADFLNVARPSLSRELMKMQEDGLVKIERNKIKIIDFDEIQNNL